MSSEVYNVIRTIFSQSTLEGPVRQPLAVTSVLTLLQTAGNEGSGIDVGALEAALDDEFPFRNELVYRGRLLGASELEQWTCAVRWLYQQLINTDVSRSMALSQAQVVFTSLGALDVGTTGLEVLAEKLKDSRSSAYAIGLIRSFEHRLPNDVDAALKNWMEKLLNDVEQGKFDGLTHALSIIRTNVGSDQHVAIQLLRLLQPDELSKMLSAKNSLIFSLVVCQVLGGVAPVFALDVENVVFKFVSTPYLHEASSKGNVNSREILTKILVQVSKTPHWHAWLSAFHRYPHFRSVESHALAVALSQLKASHWADFIDVVDLSTSPHLAESIAEILTQFTELAGADNSQNMWELAFQRWNHWDYGRHDESASLPSPRPCSFDFPVSMYYSHLSAEQLKEEEAKLVDRIQNIEQEWFSSEIEIHTQRNRLASRLRLVRHGQSIASGDLHALPPPVQADSDYAAVRFRFFDVDAINRRVLGDHG